MARKPFAARSRKGSGNTKYYTFKGLVSYAKIYEPDEFRGVTKWKLNLHPSDEVIQEIKAAGIQKKLKDSNEEFSGVPGKFFTFDRPTEREFNGEVTYFAPPAVYDADGGIIAEYEDNGEEIVMKGKKQIIGNGSEIEVNVAVYETKRFGKGCRLNYIKVLDLVEWVPEDAPEEEDEEEEVVVRKGPAKKAVKAASADEELPW